jgi:hypothetical protein
MQGPAGATAPGLAAAPPFGLEAPYLGQQTAGIHLLPPGRHAPLSRPLTITSTRPSGAASPFLTGDTAEPSRSCSRARRCLECRANRGESDFGTPLCAAESFALVSGLLRAAAIFARCSADSGRPLRAALSLARWSAESGRPARGSGGAGKVPRKGTV